jgi:hypothetical protein
MSSAHPGTHSFAAVQYAPLAHTSLSGRHSTQTAFGTSQSGPFGEPAQSASTAHSAVLPPAPPLPAVPPVIPPFPAVPPVETPPVPPPVDIVPAAPDVG